MLRRSSNRAFSSTRQTLCLPSSIASISAGTSGVSSLVRYTVAFSAITSGSPAAVRTNASKLEANESYGWWTRMSAFAISEKIVLGPAANRGWRDRHPGLILQLGPVEARELHRVREVEQPVDEIDLVVLDAEAPLQPVEHHRRDRRRHLDPDDVAEPPSAQLQLDCLEQVVGLVRDLEVGVAGEPEHGPLADLHLREQ